MLHHLTFSNLFQNFTPIISLTIWYVTTLLNLGFTCSNICVQYAKQ